MFIKGQKEENRINNEQQTRVNNKEADQHVHLHCLINVFVIHCLDSVIPITFY